MLSSQARISKAYVPEVIRRGRGFSSAYFSLKALYKPEAVIPRFGVVVSKKIDKRAVYRNTMRRRVYVAVCSALKAADMKLPAGFYLIFVQKTLEGRVFSEIEQEIAALLRKAGVSR